MIEWRPILGFWILASFTATGAQTNTIIIPRGGEAAFGNTFAGILYAPDNVQQVYAARNFDGAPADILKINEIAFRVEESKGDFNDTLRRLTLTMNLFPGTMEEAVMGNSALVTPLTTVFTGTNLAIQAKAGVVDRFDFRFPLDRPFVYDRRKGQLVVMISHPDAQASAALDTEEYFDGHQYSFKQGAIILPRTPDSAGAAWGALMVTRFTYSFSSAELTKIAVDHGDTLRLEFTVNGDLLAPEIQEADQLTGRYASAMNSKIIKLTDKQFQAILPLPETNRFFQVLLR